MKIRLAGIGCGGRTLTYFQIANGLPDKYELVAAADPNEERLNRIASIDPSKKIRIFLSDKEFLSLPKMADVVVIGTQDSYHYEPCLACLEKGYDVLLEKPISIHPREILKLEQRAKQLGRKVLVCHVLRYAPFYEKVKELVDSGILGKIVNIHASEGVGTFHQAHSFVRGHWSVTEKATPMIVAKSCHDMDILSWLMQSPCEKISSFGGISHFKADKAPQGAPKRCTEGCPVEKSCIYNAMLYAQEEKGWLQWIYDKTHTATLEEIRGWLAQSPWGRCVYHCDNTAVDHQTVNLAFANGSTATFIMTAFDAGRNIVINGTEGFLYGGHFCHHQAGHDIVVHRFNGKETLKINIEFKKTAYHGDGHGGGDTGLIEQLYEEMQKKNPEDMKTSLSQSVESHLIAFAAEKSRIENKTVSLENYKKEILN